jgi:hypothetical protein
MHEAVAGHEETLIDLTANDRSSALCKGSHRSNPSSHRFAFDLEVVAVRHATHLPCLFNDYGEVNF